MVAASLAVAASGLVIFLAPGAVALAASGIRIRGGERVAWWFAGSLVLLAAAFAAALALSLPVSSAPALLAASTAVGAGAARLLAGRDAAKTTAAQPHRAPLAAWLLLAVLVAGAIAAAVAFAPVGSVDRWWYLAYVRGYLSAPALGLAEPFLGTGRAFARFGVHPWLFGLAAWSSLSGVDPVVVYERAAPGLVVAAAASAALALANALFADGRRARPCVVATMLLWSGATLPVLARAGEDKVLAAAALVPLAAAAALGALRSRDSASRRRSLVLLAVAAVATAAVHALAYAFTLLALLPTAALVAAREPAARRGAVLAAAVLLVVAVAPAASGLVVRGRLHDIGAELSQPDHPVVRVHEGRERIVELPAGGFVISPRLLVHPLALLALGGLPLLWSRRGSAASPAANLEPPRHDDDPPLDDAAWAFLASTTALPLAVAFLPPLPALAGTLIPPWMVYRVLWLLPVAPLAAVAAGALARRLGRGEAAASLLLLALGLPAVALAARDRLDDVRDRLAEPSSREFRGLVAALRELPADALVVAAPELAERIPALAARHVVAGLDRSTIVFAGSRDAGEARLRARAALLAGDADRAVLAHAAGLHATHAVYDPEAPVRPRCAKVLYSRGRHALCSLPADPTGSFPPSAMETLDAEGGAPLETAKCRVPPRAVRRDPWSASPPVTTCHVELPAPLRGRGDLALAIDAVTGRAVDELRVVVRDGPGRYAFGTARTHGASPVLLALPASDAGTLELRIGSAFLPAIRIRSVTIVAR